MDEEWVSIYTSAQLYEIEIIRGLLLENDIETYVMNRQDSSYLFGEIDLLVNRDDYMKAKQIIQKNNNIE